MSTTPELNQRTKQFALRVIRLYSALPKSPVATVLGKQLLRSGTSVGANYQEATHSRSKAEFVAKMGDCLKELAESKYWLDLMAESGLVGQAKLAALQKESDELAAIFYTIIQKTKTNEK